MNRFPPAVRWLIISNVLIFILDALVLPAIAGGVYTFVSNRGEFTIPVTEFHGALWPLGSENFMPWQYFTYMFFHGGLGHIFSNMLMLWVFGTELEQIWGSRRFLVFYLICGLAAGIIHSIVTLWMGDAARTIGASGAVMGVAVAFGMIYPDRVIYLNFIFPVKVKYLVMFYIAYDLFSGFVYTGDRIAHFAHLGGALAGFILVKLGGGLTLGGIFDRFSKKDRARPEPRTVAPKPNVVDVQYRDVPAREPVRRAPMMNFGDEQERIDAILDKISRHGYQSLSEEEKAILNEASKKM